MGEENSTEWLTTIISNHDEQNSISKVIKAETKSGTKKGDNYSGDLKKIELEILLKSGRKVKKSLILKLQPTTDYRRELGEKMGITRREIMMYRDVLPSMEEIMREFGDYTEFMWGSCLYFRMYDQLILNDLTDDGYIMLDRKQGMDLQHCLLVMRSLAKFHATSVILKERGLLFMEIFDKHIFEDDSLREINDKFQENGLTRLANMVDTWGGKWNGIALKLRTMAPIAMRNVVDSLKADDKKFNVLCHGDCWINNMLFKNGLDDKTPISVKFIDFQISFYNSPAFDLKYFFASSPNLEVRKSSIPQLIEVYHETLTRQLELYSYKGNIITLEDLNEEMRRIELFGLCTAIGILPIVLLENTQAIPDMEEVIKDLVETKKIDEQNWAEYFKPGPLFAEFLKEYLNQAVKNNSF